MDVMWRTVTYECPYLDRQVSEIWSGLLPCVAVNVYLRESAELQQWDKDTVYTKASRLLHFVRWLSERQLSFWDHEVRLGGSPIVAFRNSLFERVNPTNPQETRPLSMSSANRIMGEVLDLCRFWAGKELVRGDNRQHGRKGEKGRPAAFKVKTRNESRRGKESLRREEIGAIWNYLFVQRRPPRKCPLGESRERWQLRTALWARDCMVWALFMCTGLRRGEAPAIMLEDVRHDGEAGWWVHLVDPKKTRIKDPRREKIWEYGAELKSGSRELMVWFEDEFKAAFTMWSSVWRPFLVAKTGLPDHGMLLVSKGGGPSPMGAAFTYNCTRQFFHMINENVGPFRGDSGAGVFRMSAHRVRHTLESYMKSERVPLPVRQQVLGHRRPETTDLYGSVWNTELLRARAEFHDRIRGGDDG